MSKTSYYMDTGAKNGFYTLHRVTQSTRQVGEHVEHFVNDTYIKNLSTDWDTAVSKAKRIAGNVASLHGISQEWALTPFTKGRALWEFTLENIDPNIMPAGKLSSQDIRELDLKEHGEYLEWYACFMLEKDHSRSDNYTFIATGVAILLHISDWIDNGRKRYAPIVENQKPEVEVREPVVEGRTIITGTIVKTDSKPDGFGGYRYVMTVKDDRGFLVWGTNPSNLDGNRGDRVEFTATCEQSQRDVYFGFFKRPTKAKLLDDASNE